MRDYLYSLVRYVPDRERMEPINVGVVLQGDGATLVKLNQHAAKRRLVDTDAFRTWKEFFAAEIGGEDDPLFSPPKSSPEFLNYLIQLCTGPILMSRPLQASFDDDLSASQVLQKLFARLVLPPEDLSSPDSRPTSRFRELESEYHLLQRGMKKHAAVPLPGVPHWRPYRQVLNGEFIAIDKIEVARELGRTAEELNGLAVVNVRLKDFLASGIEGRETRYVLLADEMTEPFREQSNQEFEQMHDDVERTVDIVRNAGGIVFRSPAESEQFARHLDATLPAFTAN